MHRLPLLITVLLIATPSPGHEPDDGFVPLFNGKNLDNWIRTNTPPDTWTVRDGMLICSGKPYGELRTREMYQNFILDLEWRHLVPRGNAGIFLWADDLPARGVPFHRGIEVQVLELAYGNTRSHTTHGDIFPIHGAVMTPNNGRGGSRAFPIEMRARPAPEWNRYTITCNDGTVELEVNGALVTSGHSASPRKGYLCLESEGGIVHFRNMKIKTLPDTPIEDEDIAIAYRGYELIYSGLDLSGWVAGDAVLTSEQESNGWAVADWKLKHSGSESELRSVPLTGRTGVLLDIRNTDEDAWAAILLSTSNGTAELATLNGDDSTPRINPRFGAWNRVEFDWKDGQPSLRINGDPVSLPTDLGDPGTDPTLILQATGSVEFANLFAR